MYIILLISSSPIILAHSSAASMTVHFNS